MGWSKLEKKAGEKQKSARHFLVIHVDVYCDSGVKIGVSMKGEARGGKKTKDKRRVARSRMKMRIVTKREAGLVKRQ